MKKVLIGPLSLLSFVPTAHTMSIGSSKIEMAKAIIGSSVFSFYFTAIISSQGDLNYFFKMCMFAPSLRHNILVFRLNATKEMRKK